MKYRPTLTPIKVPIDKLLLDPNNPRFLEDHEDRVEDSQFADPGVQIKTAERMRRGSGSGSFRLDELKESILANGWQPVDRIFVRKIEGLPGSYVVLEGNRRLTALRDLKDLEPKIPDDLLKAFDPLSVLEVVSAASIEESRAQITYLLGVRHHGSLKTWGPFAQAHNIFERYLLLGKMTEVTFLWNEDIAEKIGQTLGVAVEKVRERLQVYRAMVQLNQVPSIGNIDPKGLKGKYYSLVKDGLSVKGYITQDPVTFKLDDASIARFDTTCHFSALNRNGAPISSPTEWRPLAKILKDEDPEKVKQMIEEVEVHKRTPSDVYAERQAELRQPRWDRWLIELAELLRRLKLGNVDSEDEKTVTLGRRVAEILDSLNSKLSQSTATKEA
jgi:hypothetical protein